jgi:hypothetical protein
MSLPSKPFSCNTYKNTGVGRCPAARDSGIETGLYYYYRARYYDP